MVINILAVVTILILIVSTILNLTLISNIALSFLVLLIPVYILKDTRLKQLEAERRFIDEYQIPEIFKNIIENKPKTIKESYEVINKLAENIDKLQKYDDLSIQKLNERLALIQDKF